MRPEVLQNQLASNGIVTIRIYLNQIFKDFHIKYAQLVAIGSLCTLYIVCCNGSDDLWKSESWTVSANKQ